jgi:CheY-like chemotaxis protein
MKTKLDSTTLFLAQARNHTEELGRLLSVNVQEEIERKTIERSILSTTMLANSSSLMDLGELTHLLSAYANLLETYKGKQLHWEERIAQLTSELIEKEEYLITGAQGKKGANLNGVISSEEFQALQQELTELQAFAELSPTPGPTADPAQSKDHQPPAAEASKSDSPPAPHNKLPQADRPLARSIGDLRRHSETLLEYWSASEWDLEGRSASKLEQVRRTLFLIDFFALSIEQIIAAKTDDRSQITMESLAPIQSAIEDFARVLCVGTSRRIDITFIGENSPLDARLLFSVQKVLQCMISDILMRCDDQYLRVEVVVTEKHGSLFWSLRDNGNNFITDSRLDPDEYLAFYPGLRETRRILAEFHSLLWVEPNENHDTRFSFTTPASPDGGRFMVWGSGPEAFAVLSNQVSQVLRADEVSLSSDSRGDFMVLNDNKVPVVRLGQVYSGAPWEGDEIVVIGCLEKRIGIYAAGDASLQNGVWQRDAVPVWRGMDQGVARIKQDKIPLVEANNILTRYMHIINDTDEGEFSGGGVDEESDLSQTQAQMEKDLASPPEFSAEGGRLQVLIVERSAALQEAFSKILSDQLSLKAVRRLDDAMDCISKTPPSLIISEFRVPSMAAKFLAEKLKAEGLSIPVLVTTTHSGDKAELLVSKLEVAGYISKPLETNDVLNRVDEFVRGGMPSQPVR